MKTFCGQALSTADGAILVMPNHLPVQSPLAARLNHFCDVVVGRVAPIINAVDALQSLRAVEAVRRLRATGQTVVLQDLR
jgi:predicted dehydrogenase